MIIDATHGIVENADAGLFTHRNMIDANAFEQHLRTVEQPYADDCRSSIYLSPQLFLSHRHFIGVSLQVMVGRMHACGGGPLKLETSFHFAQQRAIGTQK